MSRDQQDENVSQPVVEMPKNNDSSAEKSASPIEHVHGITLENLKEAFSNRGNEAHVKKLLLGAATLQAWKSEAHPSHKQRDAMMKLGTDWNVPQKIFGKKRAPAYVAKDLERELLDTAQGLVEKRNPFFGKRCAAKPAQKDTSPQSSKRQCKS
jgi:hypothetical protein